MRKKLFTAMAGIAAIAGGLMSSPSGQQIVEQNVDRQGQQVTKQTQSRNAVNQSQQASQRAQTNRVSQSLTNPYSPFGGGMYYGSGYGLSPKEYGEYLMRTGKNKYNQRKRKHYAKAIS